jgi:predicted metalloprotease
MQWKGRRESDRVEDARNDSQPMMAGGAASGLMGSFYEWSVRLELQTDYPAGVWAHPNQRYLDRRQHPHDLAAAV